MVEIVDMVSTRRRRSTSRVAKAVVNVAACETRPVTKLDARSPSPMRRSKVATVGKVCAAPTPSVVPVVATPKAESTSKRPSVRPSSSVIRVCLAETAETEAFLAELQRVFDS